MRSFFRRHNRGFTLTEIIFSVLILAGTMIPIAALMGRGYDGTRRDQRQIFAIQLCQARLNQAMSLPFDKLVDATSDIFHDGELLLPLGDTDLENYTFNVRLDVEERGVSFPYQSVDINVVDYDVEKPETWVFQAQQSLDIASTGNVAKLVSVVVSWPERETLLEVKLSTFRANLEL